MAPEQIDKLTIERIASWENDRILPAAGELATYVLNFLETEQLHYLMVISDLGSWRRVITPALATISSPPSPAGLFFGAPFDWIEDLIVGLMGYDWREHFG
jgi:hypothetical protein